MRRARPGVRSRPHGVPHPPPAESTAHLLLFGVRPGAATVRLYDERLTARVGFFRVEGSLANIVGWDITGAYRWWPAVGVTCAPPKNARRGSWLCRNPVN